MPKSGKTILLADVYNVLQTKHLHSSTHKSVMKTISLTGLFYTFHESKLGIMEKKEQNAMKAWPKTANSVFAHEEWHVVKQAHHESLPIDLGARNLGNSSL